MAAATVYYCPFCRREIARTRAYYNELAELDALDELERKLRAHLIDEHPVRRRLRRRMRRAVGRS